MPKPNIIGLDAEESGELRRLERLVDHDQASRIEIMRREELLKKSRMAAGKEYWSTHNPPPLPLWFPKGKRK